MSESFFAFIPRKILIKSVESSMKEKNGYLLHDINIDQALSIKSTRCLRRRYDVMCVVGQFNI